jgi:serine/threonine-protein kinase RsbW
LNRSKLVLKLSLLSDPQLLCVVRAAVGEMSAKVGFSEPEVRSIVLAIDEALANVIRHGYHGSVDRPIQLSFYRGQMKRGGEMRGALQIQIVDRGVPVVPDQMVGRKLDDIRPGGLGLHFIRETMDSVVFRHSRGRNYLRLIKCVTPDKPNGTTAGCDLE